MIDWNSLNWSSLGTAMLETLGMTLISTVLAYLVGLPLGIILYVTGKKGIRPNKWINIPLGIAVNIMRSIPCLLLIIILLPLTRAVVGRGTGQWYTMLIPLFFASFAFVSRVVEGSLNDLDPGAIEATKSMGASDMFIIWHVLLREAKPALINGLSLVAINIIGYTSFAADFAAGGLIATAFFDYQNHSGAFLDNPFSRPVIWVCIIIIVILVQIIQEAGLYAQKKTDKRSK